MPDAPLIAYGNDYTSAGQNALQQQGLEDSYLFNLLANRGRAGELNYQRSRAASDDTYRNWLARQDQAYKDRALAQSGSQFGQDLAFRTAGQQNEQAYRNASLAQTGSQFDRDLAYRNAGRNLDNTYRYDTLNFDKGKFDQQMGLNRDQLNSDIGYKYAALNQGGQQAAASLAQRAAESDATNQLGWAGLNDAAQNHAATLDYSNRALAQTGDYQDRQLGLQQGNQDLNFQHMLSQEAKADATVRRGENSNLYKELVSNVEQGVIHTPDQLASWEGGRLGSDQFNNLNALLEEANRRETNKYDSTTGRANALNFELNQKLVPYQTQYDQLNKDLTGAVDNKHWYWPGDWGHADRAATLSSIATSPYTTTRDTFEQGIGRSKAYADVTWDPVASRFVPSNPAPVGYAPQSQAPSAPPSAGSSDQWSFPNLIQLPDGHVTDSDNYDALQAEMARFPKGSPDRQGVWDSYLQHGLIWQQPQAAAPTPADSQSYWTNGARYMN